MRALLDMFSIDKNLDKSVDHLHFIHVCVVLVHSLLIVYLRVDRILLEAIRIDILILIVLHRVIVISILILTICWLSNCGVLDGTKRGSQS